MRDPFIFPPRATMATRIATPRLVRRHGRLSDGLGQNDRFTEVMWRLGIFFYDLQMPSPSDARRSHLAPLPRR